MNLLLAHGTAIRRVGIAGALAFNPFRG